MKKVVRPISTMSTTDSVFTEVGEAASWCSSDVGELKAAAMGAPKIFACAALSTCSGVNPYRPGPFGRMVRSTW
ncbi:MAG TPA: hypothetical protein VHN80_30340, partial [Kineosporiaceae bacterium]|nr:hypothetical protein [Kineosporiaceae bacterium]